MIEVRAAGFDPYLELSRYQRTMVATHGKFGATASFVGTMRDFSGSAAVESMTLEHYPGMTEKHLQRIHDEVLNRSEIIDALIIHRVGRIEPNEPIVLVVAWAGHRAPAFDACRYMIEELKTRAPFWKKEQGGGSVRWVETNTPEVLTNKK